MAIHWDIFKGGQTVPSNERLSVSINAKNVLTLNRYTRKILGDPEAVLVMFDKRESVIGLAPRMPPTRTDFRSSQRAAGKIMLYTYPRFAGTTTF